MTNCDALQRFTNISPNPLCENITILSRKLVELFFPPIFVRNVILLQRFVISNPRVPSLFFLCIHEHSYAFFFFLSFFKSGMQHSLPVCALTKMLWIDYLMLCQAESLFKSQVSQKNTAWDFGVWNLQSQLWNMNNLIFDRKNVWSYGSNSISRTKCLPGCSVYFFHTEF